MVTEKNQNFVSLKFEQTNSKDGGNFDVAEIEDKASSTALWQSLRGKLV